MRTFSLLTLVLVGAAILTGAIRQREVRQLRETNEALRLLAAEREQLDRQKAAFENIEMNFAELDRLLSMRQELLRLRNEVGALREAARHDPNALREELEAVLSETAQHQQYLAEVEEFRSAEKVGFELERLVHAIRDSARPDGTLAGSFAELENWMRESGTSEEWVEYLTRPDHWFGSVPGFFEFVPRTTPLRMSNGPTLLLRERRPRPQPDGGWARYYALVNGQIEEVILPENRFDQWERDRGAAE